ncbi:MAG: hypothetical protein GDA43_24875 [Hormoscilla sp. SP5CHS1]|nr:hypothetical protein [Hormoscilla sp. SP5CHS1]
MTPQVQTESAAYDRSRIKLDLMQIPVSHKDTPEVQPKLMVGSRGRSGDSGKQNHEGLQGMPVQAKLAIGEPDDKYEREADRVAKQVVQQLQGPQLDRLQLRQIIQGQGNPEVEEELQRKPINLIPDLQARPTIQRYTEIKKGSKEYPAKKKRKNIFQDKDATEDERFFTSQKEGNESFLSDDKDEKGTYLPNLVHQSEADLKISDNCDLAIEDTSDEPKNFFATKALVDSANDVLRRQGGKVTFKRTNRYLLVVSGSKEKKLYQVEPYVSTGKSSRTQGTDVRTPQRCNEMADFISGKRGVDIYATTKVNVVLADVLDKITDGRHDYGKELTTAINKCAKDMSAVKEYEELVGKLSQEFRKFMGDPSTKDKMDGLLQEANVNEYMNPDLGNAIVTISATTPEEAASRDKENTFLYHFGTVVAKSGSDYITMENYARREEKNKNKLSSGDPLFFFKMYGTKKEAITWHRENMKTGAFIGAVISFVVS